MPLDTASTESKQPSPVETETPEVALDLFCKPGSFSDERWDEMVSKLQAADKRHEASKIFGESASKGGVYQWGQATAAGYPIDRVTEMLSRLAVDRMRTQRGKHRRSSKREKEIDWIAEAYDFIETIDRSFLPDAVASANSVIWAAALPVLVDRLDRDAWRCLLATLFNLQQRALNEREQTDPVYLIAGGELGLTLCWRLGKLISGKHVMKSSVDTVKRWTRGDVDSISEAIAETRNIRLVLASLLRSQDLVRATTNYKCTKSMQTTGDWLATWALALTTRDGQSAFSELDRKAVGVDTAKNGLLSRACEYDEETLRPAFQAAIGKSHSGGRLAWQVCLPEAFHHDPTAKVVSMFADWDVRRGRVHLDYSPEEIAVEIFGGKSTLMSGPWQTLIQADSQECQPDGRWTETCDYTDDDVHYVELEQPWTYGLSLQRQIMLLREDRALLIADAVLPADPHESGPTSIHYQSRLPLSDAIEIETEEETRELYLHRGRRRAMLLPLAANEWKIGPSAMQLDVSEDHQLVLSMTGKQRLYCPLWIDLQTSRFKRKRTWRSLTVANELQIVPASEASGFRLQMGPEHWVIYRSLASPRCQTFLGKHLKADFFCSRFDPGDGSHEELINVNDDESEDE